MNFKTTVFALLAVLPLAIQAQTLKGVVEDQNGKTVDKASVTLLRAKDSTEIRGTATGADGVYQFGQVSPGRYLVAASSVGMTRRYSDVLSIGRVDVTVKALRMTPEVKEVAQVTVTSRRPLVEQKIDRTIVNVDASPTNVGTTVMDVLQKSPGISVDKDGNISLKGKSGVLVMIDGRPTYLSATDLANLLKNMPSSEVVQIEIMTNPPAKYDAAGNAGVINLKTKKNKAVGFNASITIGGGEGKGPKANNSLNLNYPTGKFNFFGNYNESYNEHPQTLNLVRNFRAVP